MRPSSLCNTCKLTFLIVLQKEVEVAKLTEHICVNFPLTLKDECIIAANSLWKQKRKEMFSRLTKQNNYF